MGIMPIDFINLIRNGQNPQQLMLSFLEDRAKQNNPMAENMLNLAKDGKSDSIEAFARNYMKSQGKDFDKEFDLFRKRTGL